MTRFQVDRHLHTTYSDGTAPAEAMIERAIELGFTQLAITDHMPLPFADASAMPRERLADYRAELGQLAEQYAGQIELLIGLEIDYLENDEAWTEEILQLGWDYTTGSVHFLLDAGGRYRVVDGAAEFEVLLTEVFAGDSRALCERYFEQVGRMVRRFELDQVSHLDLVKKFNAAERYFADRESWYRAAVYQVLDTMAERGVALEINTAGLDKPVQEVYPADWIIERARDLNIPLTVNSDAHTPAQIGRYFSDIKQRYF